jgi:cobyrinic acid a,c-diamide synthase
MLQECGAELVFFSPVHDRKLPAADGLLLGGGYPELHAQALAQNEEMKAQIRKCAAEGMPILAECGGFMYLQENLILTDPKGDFGKNSIEKISAAVSEDSPEKGSLHKEEILHKEGILYKEGILHEQIYKMCGALPGTCRMTDHLVRFGYIELEKKAAESTEAGYLEDGHRIRGHEFHYFDSTDNGQACTAHKPARRRSWDCMVVQDNIMAGFPHLYYRSDPAFAEAFVEKCRQFSRK